MLSEGYSPDEEALQIRHECALPQVDIRSNMTVDGFIDANQQQTNASYPIMSAFQ